MKLIAVCILTAIIHVSIPAMAQRVTLHVRDMPLEQVFMEIRKQTGLEFLYQQSLIADIRPVTLDVEQLPVYAVLKICLEGQGLSFTIRSRTVVIFRSEEPAAMDRRSDTHTPTVITGRIIDTNNLPVPMASVTLLHTRAGTQTNRSGSFMLKLKHLKDTLVISCIGYKERRVPLDSLPDLRHIILQPADNSLDESIVVAYGTTSDRYRTGAISTVSALDIERSPAPNVLEALAGRVPGLYVRQDGDNPTNPYSLNLRGYNVLPPTTNFTGNSELDLLSMPVIAIDGIPISPDFVSGIGSNWGVNAILGIPSGGGGQDDLYWLNPQDVESVTVLKDAEATALYGSRAANGVILVTTKKAKSGKPSLHLNFNTGINTQASHADLMNTKQYLAMRREAWNNTTRAGLYVYDYNNDSSLTANRHNAYDLLVFDTTRNTNWQKYLLGSAPVYNAGLELSGGEGRTAYRLSAGYNGWKSPYPAASTVPAFREDKGTLALTTTSRSKNNRFKAVNTLLFSVSSSIQPVNDPDAYLFTMPDAPPVFDRAGKIDFDGWPPSSQANPYISNNDLSTLGTSDRLNRSTWLGRTSLSYELFPSFTLTFAAGYSKSDGKLKYKLPQTAISPVDSPSQRFALFGNSSATDLDLEPNLRYTAHWRHSYLELFGGGSYETAKQRGTVLLAEGYSSDAQLNSLQGANVVTPLEDNFIQRATVSAFGRIAYRWYDALLVDGSARRDGSSSFGPGHRYGNFGSIGAGWIFTASSWAKRIPGLSFGKLRGSYGITGIQSSDPYAYLSVFAQQQAFGSQFPNYNASYFSNGSYQGSPTLGQLQPANATLGWAQATSLDVGADLYFLADQRLKFTAQWYQKNTGHQLVSNNVAAVTGTADYLENWPAKVRNTGVEFLIDFASPHRLAGINWSMGFNLAANHNKLVAYPELENSPFAQIFSLGQPIVQQQLYRSVLNKTYGIWMASGSMPLPYNVSNYPAFTGGLQTVISYKAISLSVSCTFARQKGFSNLQGAAQPGELPNLLSNQLASVITKKHWQSPADSTIGGGLYAASLPYNNELDIYWHDESYIAVKNATLSYTLPKTWLKKSGVNGFSCYLRADNLLLLSLSGYKGFNVEQPGLVGTIDLGTGEPPLRKTIVAGFSLQL